MKKNYNPLRRVLHRQLAYYSDCFTAQEGDDLANMVEAITRAGVSLECFSPRMIALWKKAKSIGYFNALELYVTLADDKNLHRLSLGLEKQRN